jgi:hypothetical protein
MRVRQLLVLAMLTGLVACTSPEATRQRAGGPGADVANRAKPVELHAGADPYYGTPIAMPRARGTPLASSPPSR